MASNIVLKRANASTIQDKFMVGYQGWFTCPGDGEPVGPGHHGWLHWFNYPIPDGGRPNTDVWPDVSEYPPSELYPAPGLKTKSGEQTFLFSSRNSNTVKRHFHWMAKHGVDGAFLQRFAGQCDMESGNEGIRRIRDEVGERVREAAELEGRVFAIMYDVSGVPPDRIQKVLERDWVHVVRTLRVLDSPNYLKEKGKPVVALWGFGFDNSKHTPALVRAITEFFRNTTPGGVYIMAGVPSHWRTAEGDADRNPEFLDVWLNEVDAISPWTVGRYSTEKEADNFAEIKMKGDMALIKKQNESDGIRKIDYIPVVLPGGSGYNLSEGKWGLNNIKREGGRFLWKQIYNAHRLGVRTIYGAMWDEYDEGTAFMPIVEHKRDLPESAKYPFLALDADGYEVPSDWYMRICGLAAEGLRNERPVSENFPLKELEHYWSSRPRYEELNSKSKESMSGSSSSASAETSNAAGGVDPGGGGQTYEEWLALQKEEKDDVPPPPYTLGFDDDDESTDPIPSQTVTNIDTRVAAAAVATAPEVPSVVVQNAPVVANVPPVASPPPVNISTRPASTAPTLQAQAHPQVSAQSSQPYPPVQGHSPRPYSPPGGVHRPQSPSREPYPPPGGVHHPQPRPPSRGHSPQPPLTQVHTYAAGQSTQSYPSAAVGQHRPQSPSRGPYPPPGGVHHPQPRPPSRGHPPQPPLTQVHSYTAGQPTQSYTPPAGGQHPQSYRPTQVQASQPYSPVGGQPAQSYHAVASRPDLPSGEAQSPQSYSPHSQGQAPHAHSPNWGQHPQSYSTAGGSSYQGYPASTGHSHGYPPAGAPSQGYNAQSAQSYPSNGGGPVRQGYPPADGSSLQNYPSSHNQLQDPITTLTNEFGRQNIPGPSGGGGDGRLPTPPPLHPTHPGNSGYHVSRPLRPSTATQVRPPSQTQNRPPQSGHHHHSAAAATSLSPSSSVQETSKPATSTQNRPRWPPAEWDLDTPPVPKFSAHPERRPSSGGNNSGLGGGANLTRPQTFSASSYNLTGGGSSALRPTSSLSNKPPPRPNTASGTNTTPSRYSPPVAESTYINNVAANTHDHYGSSSYLSTGGPPVHGQHGPPVGFPTGPQYNSPYTPSSYPGQPQGASMYNSGVHGSSYAATSVAWPGPGHVSPPLSPTMAFPGSQFSYDRPGVGGSQYPGGPAFPSGSSSPTGGVSFPQAPGDGTYFGSNMPSSSSPHQGYGASGPYSQSLSAPWMSTAPPMPVPPSVNYPSSSSAKPSLPSALGLALNAVDKIAGKQRDRIESHVENLAQSSSKLLSKFK
ncbi:hypothetical protein BYT27DRAFT_7203403 [Phlegmacium glaucopus]|nr:hypothetical protein BYT27DRAFT_7203403 [Phlegmacium glaucopus]